MKNGEFDLLAGAMKELEKEVDVDDFLDNPGKYSVQIAKTVLKKPGLMSMLKHL
jgi:hypothetical protein